MLPNLLSMIGEDQIKPLLEGMESGLIKKINEVELQEDEEKASGLIYEEEGKVYYAIIALDQDGKIIRFVEYDRLSTALNDMLTKIKEHEISND